MEYAPDDAAALPPQEDAARAHADQPFAGPGELAGLGVPARPKLTSAPLALTSSVLSLHCIGSLDKLPVMARLVLCFLTRIQLIIVYHLLEHGTLCMQALILL